VDRPARLFALAAAGAAAALALAGALAARRSAPFRTFEGEAMATRWVLSLPDRPGAGAAAAACFARFRALDLELSEWRDGSPLSAVNRAAGRGPVAVPGELFALLRRSLELARATDGAFDVSWAALWGLWDFRSTAPRPPDPSAVEARRRFVDYRSVRLDPAARTVELPKAGMQLGLGAIGKGYALDACAALLEARGFRDFLLVAGGQVLARGARGGRPWRIGLRDPRGAPEEIFARFALADGSLSTSADNERYFESGGVRYHHVLDPRTGWPARGTRSATVLHPEATVADALSTALLVLGAGRGFEVVRALGGEALAVDEAGEVATTPGFERGLERLRPPRRG
jgi:thiamine biosynthesis lipoprotein